MGFGTFLLSRSAPQHLAPGPLQTPCSLPGQQGRLPGLAWLASGAHLAGTSRPAFGQFSLGQQPACFRAGPALALNFTLLQPQLGGRVRLQTLQHRDLEGLVSDEGCTAQLSPPAASPGSLGALGAGQEELSPGGSGAGWLKGARVYR